VFCCRRRTQGLRKLLDYFGSTFLLFFTYFFIYAPPISNGVFKSLGITRVFKPSGIMGGFKTPGITGVFKLSGIMGVFKPPGIMGVSKPLGSDYFPGGHRNCR